MGQKKLAKRSKVKPFIKVRSPVYTSSERVLIWKQVVNYSHLFPTRYALELEGLKGTVAAETFKEPSQREDAKKNIKKLLEERYQSGKNKWFFQALRVRSRSGIDSCGATDRLLVLRCSYHFPCPSSLQHPKCMHHDPMTFAFAIPALHDVTIDR